MRLTWLQHTITEKSVSGGFLSFSFLSFFWGKEKRTELAILCGLKERVTLKQSASNKWLSLRSSWQEILDPLGTNYTFDVGLAWATDATLSQEKWVSFLRSGKRSEDPHQKCVLPQTPTRTAAALAPWPTAWVAGWTAGGWARCGRLTYKARQGSRCRKLACHRRCGEGPAKNTANVGLMSPSRD